MFTNLDIERGPHIVGNGGMGVAGITIDSYCGSLPHSLLSTSKMKATRAASRYMQPGRLPAT